MYNNPYMNYNNPYGQQSLSERIDGQIAQLNQMKEQLKNQSGGITQNFQLTPTQNGIKYANTINEVEKENVFIETAFFSKDLSVVWIKNPSGNIRIFELKETKLKDEKDLLIDALMLQIEDLKKGINKNESKTNVNEPDSNEKPSNVSTVSKPSKESK